MTPRNFEDTSRATHVMPLWLMELPLSAATVWLVLETAGRASGRARDRTEADCANDSSESAPPRVILSTRCPSPRNTRRQLAATYSPWSGRRPRRAACRLDSVRHCRMMPRVQLHRDEA